MAHIHNAILRGYNSIYQQAAHVKEEDKAAFVGYALAWYRFVKSHHDDEEAELFPKVEEVLGTKGVWDETHAEHGKLISLSFSANKSHPSLPCNDFPTNETRQNPSSQASHP
jgi:hemerythrin-like domain-containing protein